MTKLRRPGRRGHGRRRGVASARELPTKIEKVALFEPPFIVDDSRPPMPADLVTKVNELVSSGRRGAAVELFMAEAVGVPAEFVDRMKQSPMWAGMEKRAHTIAYDILVMGDTQSGQPLPSDRWASVAGRALVLDGEKSDTFLRNAA